MAAQVRKLLLEVDSVSLVLVGMQEVLVRPHLGCVSAIDFQHVSEWLLAFYVDSVQDGDELKRLMEVVSEAHQFRLVFKVNLRKLSSEGHVLKSPLITKLHFKHQRIELIELKLRANGKVIGLIEIGVFLGWHDHRALG